MTSKPSRLPLTLAQLECFVAVVETGSLAAAGRLLGLTTSAVSKTISRLEHARSVRLINRSTHALSVTPEGEPLVELARISLRAVQEVDSAMSDVAAEGAVGKVRISAPTAFLAACLVPLTNSFRAAYPNILLDLRGSDTAVDLAEDGIDLALRMGPISGIPGHLQQVLFRCPYLACASPTYLHARGLPHAPADLAGHDQIGFRNQRTGLVQPWRFRSAEGEALSWDASPMLILDDANAGLVAAVEGHGLIWAPSWLVAQALRNGRLVTVLDDYRGDAVTMSIIRRNHSHSPERLAHVIEFLKQAAPSFVEIPWNPGSNAAF